MIESYKRDNPGFSLCGLNCSLCPNYYLHSTGVFQCPGCGGKGFYAHHPACSIITCAQKHGNIEYCFQCTDYPCARYQKESEYDSFVTYQHVHKDFEKAQRIGIPAYQAALDEKAEILRYLLANFNDGRRKTFFCTAVNLLELADVRNVMKSIEKEIRPDQDLKERAKAAVRLFQDMAGRRGMTIKLRKKKS